MRKLVVLLARGADTSMDAFERYYEDKHVPEAKKRIPVLERVDYRRNYVRRSARGGGPDFDVVTEITFADDADHDAFRTSMADPAVQAWMAEDEARFSDPARAVRFWVDERR